MEKGPALVLLGRMLAARRGEETQRAVARRMGTPATFERDYLALRRVEAALRFPPKWFMPAWFKVFGEDAEVRLALKHAERERAASKAKDAEERKRSRVTGGASGTITERTRTHQGGLIVDRRKFLARTSQAGTAVAGALTVGGITTESVDPAMRAAQAAMLRRAHAHTPAEKLLPQTRQFINLADHDATEATDQQRPALLRALAEGHLLAATMYASEARDDTRAQRHIRQALDAAKQAGREQAGKVWVLALAKYAQLPEYADRPGLGVVSINGADQRLHGAPAPVASYVHLVSAEQHAKLGERRTAEAKLEQARQELIGVDADAPWDGVGVWGGVRALGYEGAVLRRFGRPTEAYQRMLTWRDQVPAGLPKHKLMAELELADTALDWGDVDLSTGHARAALLGARRTGYASTVGQVRALVDGRLAPYGKHPAVTELRDMLRVA